jgi:nucleoside-diphosphate-sugar epimerase
MTEVHTVNELVSAFGNYWTLPRIIVKDEGVLESKILGIDSTKAQTNLNWKPFWNFTEVVKQTADWYKKVHHQSYDPIELTIEQINNYRMKIRA